MNKKTKKEKQLLASGEKEEEEVIVGGVSGYKGKSRGLRKVSGVKGNILKRKTILETSPGWAEEEEGGRHHPRGGQKMVISVDGEDKRVFHKPSRGDDDMSVKMWSSAPVKDGGGLSLKHRKGESITISQRS